MSASSYDVLIVGGGMVGASLALALSAFTGSKPLRIAIIDGFDLSRSADIDLSQAAQYQPGFDTRATALSYGSKCIFESLGLWQALSHHAQAIEQIHVSEKGRFGSTQMSAQQEGLPALGYVVDNRWLGSVLIQTLQQQAGVELICPASISRISHGDSAVQVELRRAEADAAELLSAGLFIVADGMRSETCQALGIQFEEHNYHKQALVTNVETQQAHLGQAFERFTAAGPLALLPLTSANGRLNSVVWTMDAEAAEELLQLADSDFLGRLQSEFGYRLGRLQSVGRRVCFPLSLVTAKEQVRQRVLVVGNAAHSLHPVAGQGFNLALRGVARLAKILASAHEEKQELGSMQTLQAYMDARKADQQDTIRFSHLAATVFTSSDPAISIGRDLGLLGLDLAPAIKSLFVQQAAGLGGR